MSDHDRLLSKVTLTVWNNDISQNDFIHLLNTNFAIRYLIIGNTEKTENELEHYHCYIEFERRLRFSTFKNQIPSSCHIETSFGSMLQNYNYVTKNGLHYCNVDINYLLSERERKERLEDALVIDIFDYNFNLYQVLRKYPHYCLYNFKTIKDIIEYRDLLNLHKEREEE